MNNRLRIFAIVLVLSLVAMACSLPFNRPVTKVRTGAIQSVDIQVPMPADPTSGAELSLEFGGGNLKLAPGATDYLVSGKATFNVTEFEPTVKISGSSYTLRSGSLENESIPIFTKDTRNEWDLQLANTPMRLNINAGAYNGQIELGGLSLEELAISDGGADVTCAFSEPNQVEMSVFKYSTGASSADLEGLANGNFEQMVFSSGAGDYTLRFDGNLQRDASVTIDAGLATVNLIVPKGVSAQVSVDGMLSVDASGGWSQNDKVYTLSGSGPTITFKVTMGAGTLNLKTE